MTGADGSTATRRFALAAIGSVVLAGCATFSPDGGFETADRMAKERLGREAKWLRTPSEESAAREQVKTLLAKPLTVDDAVQVALLNNRSLQAAYAELGIVEADLVQAGRIGNPVFGYLNVRGDGDFKIERFLTFNVFQLLTMPLALKIEQRRFDRIKLAVAAEMLNVAAETRRTYFAAVAAQESAKYFAQVQEAAEASAELARRMQGAGNFSPLQRAREQAFYAESAAQLARARQAAVAERERLIRLLGLWGDDLAFQLPERLPDLPPGAATLRDAEATAMTTRLDIQASRRELDAVAESLGLTRATRFINALELGAAQVREPGAVMDGYDIRVEIPIFDWGGARVARAESVYMQAANRTAATAINARSEVREAYGSYRIAYDLAQFYRTEIVPLRKRIAEENLLRYNGMLIGVFELLADTREQIAAVNASIEAQRDFWIADADLQAAQNGAVAGLGRIAGRPPAVPLAADERLMH
ncbi:MAG: TolC family protein [Burkholderiales bacterium]|nr:TolC family protein [Burkholderiales bacterium]